VKKVNFLRQSVYTFVVNVVEKKTFEGPVDLLATLRGRLRRMSEAVGAEADPYASGNHNV
jgi:hypothetical protein